MEKLQSDIYKILTNSKNVNKYLTQHEVWEQLIDYDFINITDPIKTNTIKRLFLDSFLTMISKYDDIVMKINSEKYLISYIDNKEISNIPENKNYEVPFAFSDHKLLLDSLVKTGACMNEPLDEEGNTLLHYLVCCNDSNKIYKYLISFQDKVDINIKNEYNKTAYDMADTYIRNIFNKFLERKKLSELENIKKSVIEINNKINDFHNQLTIIKKDIDKYKVIVNSQIFTIKLKQYGKILRFFIFSFSIMFLSIIIRRLFIS